MPLQAQLIQVPTLGLNTRADPRAAKLGEFDLIENMYFRRTTQGGAELLKRFGGASLTKTTNTSVPGPLTVGRKLATYNNERLLLADSRMWSYSPTFNLWQTAASALTNISPVAVSVEPVGTSPTQTAPDAAVGGGLLCVVYRSSTTGGAIVGTVIDLTTNQRVMSNQTLFAGVAQSCRVVALATCFMAFVSIGATITAIKIPYAAPLLFTNATVDTIYPGFTGRLDAIRNAGNDSVLLAYTTTTPNTKILIWNSNMTAGASTTNANVADQCLGWLTWDGSDGNEYLGYVSSAGGGLKQHTVTTAGPAVTATAVMDATVITAGSVTGYRLSGANQVFVTLTSAGGLDATIWRSNAGAAVTRWQPSCGLASRAFFVAGAPYLQAFYNSGAPNAVQSSVFLLDAGTFSASATGVVLGKALYGQFVNTIVASQLATPVLLGGSVMGIPTPRFVGQQGFGLSPVTMLVKYDFSGAGLSSPKKLGELLYMPGGVVSTYDGSMATEASTHLFPETPSAVGIALGGGTITPLGTYQYKFTYAWYDARGQRHQSAPSAPVTVTLAAGQDCVRLTIGTLRIGRRNIINVSGFFSGDIEAWRTVDKGTTFYRIRTTISSLGAVVDSVVFDDQNDDAYVSGGEILYTSGNVLPHIPFPPARLLEVCRNRLFLAGTENPLEMWVSNEYRSGEGVSVSDALVIPMEAEGGAITALAEFDDRLLIFKRQSIYALAGAGPSLTGDGQFDQPARITTIVGSPSPDGVVKTRDGVMFKSLRGIYLIDHGLQVSYVGAAVEAYNSLTVTGACLMEDLEQVRFVTAEGRTLVYHYGLKDETGVGLWSTFTGQAAVDCIVWNSKWVYLASDGTATEETAAWSDPGGATITAKARWAWWNLGGMFGDVRLWKARFMLEPKSSILITASYACNHDPSVVVASHGIPGLVGAPPYEVRPLRQSAAAWQWTIEETTATQGFTLSAVGLELGVSGKLRPLAVARESL